jgi:hypothetical protein
MGPQYGDAPSVGYELLYRQVTRAQGIFSPRTVNVLFRAGLHRRKPRRADGGAAIPVEARADQGTQEGLRLRGRFVHHGVMHKMKETVALIRQYAPNSKIVLGGYGTVLKDDVLKPYADFICREEGVAYFRRLLGEPEIPMPYKHPLIVSWLKVFGWKVSGTGKIFAGLGCPNGCDFCCTSHFFSRKHIKLLPTGRDIYNVVERYHDLDPSLVFLILDEDFLLNKKRAMEFRDCVLRAQSGPPSSPSPASRPSASTPWKKSWRWALTGSGSATKARGRITPSNRAGRWMKSSPNFASTASRADLDDCRV